MIKFLLKTIIVSTAVVAVPVMLIKQFKKLDEEGVFDSSVKYVKEDY